MNEAVRTSQDWIRFRNRTETVLTEMGWVFLLMFALVACVMGAVLSAIGALTAYGRVILFGYGAMAWGQRWKMLVVLGTLAMLIGV